MSDMAISIRGLGKCYRITGPKTGGRYRYMTLRDKIAEALGRAVRFRPGSRDEPESQRDFWALRDVDLDVPQGARLGIIGRNGAGKSTLLKLIGRITEPDEGTIRLRGRTACMLEVGTGFHPELTGRENIFLNGAILGMRRTEIRRKFDEIVDFADIGPFLETPIKRYSSGMYVRLAFSVAAHMEPEILLVDEIMAVGDLEFQKKCLGKMRSVSTEGRTVLFVSHSMSMVRELCSTAALIDSGKLVAAGSVEEVTNRYLATHKTAAAVVDVREADHAGGVRQVRLHRVRLLGGVLDAFAVRWCQPIEVEAEFELFEPVREMSFGAGIKGPDGTWIHCSHHDDDSRPRWSMKPGRYTITFRLANPLKPGHYKLVLGAHDQHYANNLFDVEAAVLEVLDHNADGNAPKIYNPGPICVESSWSPPHPLGEE